MALLGESLRAAEFSPREAREQTGNPATGDFRDKSAATPDAEHGPFHFG